MSDSTPQQLRFLPINDLTVRADFDGGALSSDFGPMILRGIDRLARAFVDQFIANYAKTPKLIVLDMDHSEDAAYGQQELSFYNHHYRSYCYLPLFVFEGISGKLISAILRPGKRPKGVENAMIIKHILKYLRAAWPHTHIILRGDRHFSNPELMQLAMHDRYTYFIFGMTGRWARCWASSTEPLPRI